MSADFLKTIAQYKLKLLAAKKSYYENLIKNMKPTGQGAMRFLRKPYPKKAKSI